MKNKRYYVNMRTKNFMFETRCNSIKMARWLMNLRFWKYSKIHDMIDGNNKCIEFIKR